MGKRYDKILVMNIPLGRRVHYLYAAIDFLLMIFVFSRVYIFRYGNLSGVDFGHYLIVFLSWAFLTMISLGLKNLYSTDRMLTISKEILRVFNALLYPAVAIAASIFIFKLKFFSRFIFGLSFALLVLFLAGWRIIKRIVVRHLISKGYNNFNVLIIGAGKMGRALFNTIAKHPFLGLNVKGFLDDFKESSNLEVPVIGKINNFEKICRQQFIDEVFITIPSERNIVSRIINMSKKVNVGVRVVPDNFEEPLNLAESGNIGFIPVLTYKKGKRHPAEFALKRFFDFSVSLVLLVLLSPVFVVLSLLIKLDSKGKIFYVQKRMGKKGSIFNFYKFRSMVSNADKLKDSLNDKNEVDGGIIFKMKEDPRITRIGKFMRRYSLDELPQLFNVLKGDMSLVGPRPFPVEESKKFEYNHIPRLNIRPGITGLSQVRGRSELSFKKWVKWDLWYLNNWSFGLDLLILWWTVPAVFKGKGAY